MRANASRAEIGSAELPLGVVDNRRILGQSLTMVSARSRPVMLAIGSIGFVVLAFAVVAYSSAIALALLVASIVCGAMLLRSPPSGRPSTGMRRGIVILVGLVAAWIGLLIVFFTLAPSV